jgi:anaerobic selenocysteine-containing dehydrogenase
VVAVRGDRDDVFSQGFICPKGVALKELHADPDRIRTPLIRAPGGTFRAAGWDEAFALIDARLAPILAADRNAAAIYFGNPGTHNLSVHLYGRLLARALGSRNVYTAATVDQYPKQMASAMMFGAGTLVAVPDIDRTDHLLMLGANPVTSNGSLMTAPNVRGRLRALRARGGRLVVIDPRRSRTAEEADEHYFIRPGTDAQLLFSLVHVLFDEGLVHVGDRLASICSGLDAILELAAPFSPEAVAPVCGIEPGEIRRIARELAAADRAAVYGRIGTCTQEFGALASWLIDVLNVLTGNLDREGGAMFALGAAGDSFGLASTARDRPARFGRWQSRVRGLGEVFGELPSSCLAEEIDTPGEGQVRALITVAGNPARSTPNSGRLQQALEQLEFMVSLDVYLNETTRHADVILPGPSPLHRSHYDVALYLFAVRNVANYSAPLLPPDPALPDEWVTLTRLAGVTAGLGPEADVAALDTQFIRTLIEREAVTSDSPLAAREVDDVLAELSPRTGPERVLDLLLRTGPYGLTLADLEAAPHGIDLGPLEPRLPGALRTASGRIELAPDLLVSDVPRLRATLEDPQPDGMVLIGRRHLRSNNSWMHNLPLLVKGKDRCTLQVHPADASRLELADGAIAEVRSRTGSVRAPVEVTDSVMPGVVSLPHGWGHDDPGTALAVAARHAGTNSNLLADEQRVDPVSGNGVLNGIPVELEPLSN